MFIYENISVNLLIYKILSTKIITMMTVIIIEGRSVEWSKWMREREERREKEVLGIRLIKFYYVHVYICHNEFHYYV